MLAGDGLRDRSGVAPVVGRGRGRDGHAAPPRPRQAGSVLMSAGLSNSAHPPLPAGMYDRGQSFQN